MNSVEGYKGFFTFLILSGIVLTALIGFRYIQKPTQTETQAQIEKPTAIDVQAEDVSDTSATITWQTEKDSLGGVQYTQQNIPCGETNMCVKKDVEGVTKDHSITIDGLDANTLYYYQVVIDGQAFPENSLFTFQTKEKLSTPPGPTTIPALPEYSGITPSASPVVPPSVPTEPPLVPSAPPPTVPAVPETETPDTTDVLGIQTTLVDQLLMDEFTRAIKYNDSKYDFNTDGTVTVLDYPLFLDFTRSEND